MAGEFTARFGAAPTLWTRAPGRVDLMGSHTDYNDGYILTMTIDRDTWLAARPRDRRQGLHLLARRRRRRRVRPRHSIRTRRGPSPVANYVRGMAQALQEAGYPLRGFDGLCTPPCPSPAGSVLPRHWRWLSGACSSRSAGCEIDPVTLALLGQRAENQFVGVNCGILDQYTSAMGKAGCALAARCSLGDQRGRAHCALEFTS